MASFLEIKQLIGEMFNVDNVNETDDIEIKVFHAGKINKQYTISNSRIKSAFDSFSQSKHCNLILYNEKYWELPVECSSYRGGYGFKDGKLVDAVHYSEFSISYASSEYVIFLLNCLAEDRSDHGKRIAFNARRRMYPYFWGENHNADGWDILCNSMNISTLKIRSENKHNFDYYQNLSSSFQFVCMYKKSIPIVEYSDLQELFIFQEDPLGIPGLSEVDLPPRRLYNHEVIEYYSMAMRFWDPFTAYISYYHVIEYFFDAVFRKRLTSQMKEKITHPDFSYNNEDALYKLAKFIRKQLSEDDKAGKGNELECLKYVLMEYVDIDEVKDRINSFSFSDVSYYQYTPVPFISSNKTLIGWSDRQGVYSNIANRIHETRNALVHSKSEYADKQYKPYRDKAALIREIPLIRSVAESVIIHSSEDL